MSLIHEALQNVESSFSDKDNNNYSEQLHNKNKLYKVNKFDINISSSLIILLMVSGFFSVLYIIYSELKSEKNTEYGVNDISYVDNTPDVTPVTAENAIDNELLLTDLNLESVDFNETITKSESLLAKLDSEKTNAIEGGIVGSKKHQLNDIDLIEIKKINKPLVIEDDQVYELKNSDIAGEFVESDIVAQKSTIKSDYFSLQEQAYQYIVNKEFNLAVPVLKKILTQDGNDYYANINMVLIDIESKKFIEADTRLRKLKSLYPFKTRIKDLITLVEAKRNG